jgi:hypothetical protein
MKPLAHITLNTGHRRAATRQGVLDAVVDQLLPLVDAGGGPLWVPGWHLDIMTAHGDGPDGPPVPGTAFFQIGPEAQSKTPYVMCMAAWREEVGAQAWRQAAELPALMTAALPAGWSMPSRRPSVPWVAVLVMPYAGLLPPDQIEMLGDAERCIAWTLVEADQGR